MDRVPEPELMDEPEQARAYSEADFTESHQRFADEVAARFDELRDGTGTMLDNSALMWINELSHGQQHNYNNLPIVIAGSAGGYLRQGQVVDCSRSGNLGSTDGAPHNRLLTTLLNAVGATHAGFGDLTYGMPGEIAALKT